jgi:hypothetical protein
MEFSSLCTAVHSVVFWNDLSAGGRVLYDLSFHDTVSC